MDDKSKEVSWNASQGLIMEISNRRSLANSYFIKGDIRKAFKTLIVIKQSVVQSFNEGERTKLADIEINFLKISPALSPKLSLSFKNNMKRLSMSAYNISAKLYSEYNNLLMDYLDNYGYLIGEKSDASVMKFKGN